MNGICVRIAGRLLLLLLLLLWSITVHAAGYGAVSVRKVAENVILFRTGGYGDVGMCGNSVAVLTDRGVILFDTGSVPSTAETILREIRKLTDQPVRYVINSHWHWDHWGGNQVLLSAFPDVQIITQEKTLEQMKEVEPRWNNEGLKAQLPAYIASLEKKLADQKGGASPDLEQLLKADREFYKEKSTLQKTFPNVTFSESMTLNPGGTEIRVLHARAITVGDTFVYLPGQRILITGDALLNPYPFAIGGAYPADWLKTLEMFAELKPATIIPGHGDPMSLEQLQQNITLFRALIARVHEARGKGLTLENTRDALLKDAPQYAAMLKITDNELIDELRAYFLRTFIERAYEDEVHPLGDLPDGLPQ